MRDLSVVAMLLGITAACSNQPTTTALPPAETDARPAASVSAHPTASTAPHPFVQSPWSPGAQAMGW
jgi:hypothetical protein